MDNKHFITLVSMHIAIIALMGCIFTRLRLVKIPRPLVQSLAILHANSCNKVYLFHVCTFHVAVIFFRAIPTYGILPYSMILEKTHVMCITPAYGVIAQNYDGILSAFVFSLVLTGCFFMWGAHFCIHECLYQL